MGADARIGAVRRRFPRRRSILQPDRLARESRLAGLELPVAEARRAFGAEVDRGRTHPRQSAESGRAAGLPKHGLASSGPVLADRADRRRQNACPRSPSRWSMRRRMAYAGSYMRSRSPASSSRPPASSGRPSAPTRCSSITARSALVRRRRPRVPGLRARTGTRR